MEKSSISKIILATVAITSANAYCEVSNQSDQDGTYCNLMYSKPNENWANVGLVEENTQAYTKLFDTLDFMTNSQIPQLAEAGAQISGKLATGYLDVTDGRSFKSDQPVEVTFFGGFPNLKTSSYKISVSKEGLTRSEISKADFAVYLYKANLVHEQLNVDYGIPIASVKFNRKTNALEVLAWEKAIQEIANPLTDEIRDPFIKSIVNLYRQGGLISLGECLPTDK